MKYVIVLLLMLIAIPAVASSSKGSFNLSLTVLTKCGMVQCTSEGYAPVVTEQVTTDSNLKIIYVYY